MSRESIARLRALFETELSLNPTHYHPVDIERMRTDDWQIRRYLLAKAHHGPNAEERAFTALLKTLRWKASYGIHTRTDDYFPAECWAISRAEAGYGLDRSGHPILWGVTRNFLKFADPQARLLNHQFVAHCIEQIDTLAGQTGFIIVGNLASTGLANVDLDLARFALSLIEHYPFGIKTLFVVDLPWILNSIIKMVVSLFPAYIQEIMCFLNAEQLKQYIEPRYIPVEMKGEREKEDIPQTVSLVERYEELGIEESFVRWLMKYMERVK